MALLSAAAAAAGKTTAKVTAGLKSPAVTSAAGQASATANGRARYAVGTASAAAQSGATVNPGLWTPGITLAAGQATVTAAGALKAIALSATAAAPGQASVVVSAGLLAPASAVAIGSATPAVVAGLLIPATTSAAGSAAATVTPGIAAPAVAAAAGMATVAAGAQYASRAAAAGVAGAVSMPGLLVPASTEADGAATVAAVGQLVAPGTTAEADGTSTASAVALLLLPASVEADGQSGVAAIASQTTVVNVTPRVGVLVLTGYAPTAQGDILAGRHGGAHVFRRKPRAKVRELVFVGFAPTVTAGKRVQWVAVLAAKVTPAAPAPPEAVETPKAGRVATASGLVAPLAALTVPEQVPKAAAPPTLPPGEPPPPPIQAEASDHPAQVVPAPQVAPRPVAVTPRTGALLLTGRVPTVEVGHAALAYLPPRPWTPEGDATTDDDLAVIVAAYDWLMED